MKKLTFLLTLLLVSATVSAERITEQQALQKAQSFLHEKSVQAKVSSGRQKARKVKGTATSSTLQNLYIFDIEDDGGFVIVSGDDSTDPILGYTTRGKFDECHMPHNFRAWLEQTNAEIEALQSLSMSRGAEPAQAPRQAAPHAKIDPLILTTWDQGNYENATNSDGVYNIRLPQINGKYTCAGCVATAGAQLLYYYKWPTGNTQAVPGYVLQPSSMYPDTSHDLPPVTFQWDKMKTSYSYRDDNAEAVNAVAELMLYCGYAAQMGYGINGSSAAHIDLAKGLCKYFGYNSKTWKDVERVNYSVSEWDQLIYNELASGRPVIYAGAYNNSGHAFLCDGYDGDGMYHFNWGWGGAWNGYFKLQATNPYGSSQISKMGFIADNDCIIGLQPTSWPDFEDPSADDTWEYTETGETVKLVVNDFDIVRGGEPGNYQTVRVKLTNEGDNLEKRLWVFVGTDTDWGYQAYDKEIKIAAGKTKEYHMPIGKLDAGTYTLWLLDEDSELAKKEVTIKQDLRATLFDIVGSKCLNKTLRVDVTVENHAGDYAVPLYLFASTTDEKELVYAAGSAIPNGGSDVVSFYFKPKTLGTWNLWVATDEEGTKIIGQSTVEITEPHEASLSVSSTARNLQGYVINDEAMVITVNVRNNGTYAYNDVLGAELYKLIPGTNSGTGAGVKEQFFTLEPGATTSFDITFNNMEDGASYFYYLYYYSKDEIREAGSGGIYTFNYIAPEPPSVEMQLKAGKTMAGYSFSETLDFSNVTNGKAWIAAGFVEGSKVMLCRVNIVPANTGFIVTSETPGDKIKAPVSNDRAYYANLLIPIVDAQTIYPTQTIGGVDYTFMGIGTITSTGKTGFVKVNNTVESYGPNKCLLRVPTQYLVSEARSLNELEMVFDETSSVNEELRMKNEESAPAQIYDLQGRSIFNVQCSIFNLQSSIFNVKEGHLHCQRQESRHQPLIFFTSTNYSPGCARRYSAHISAHRSPSTPAETMPPA